MDKRLKRWADRVLDSGGSVRWEDRADVALTLTMAQFEAKMAREPDGLKCLLFLRLDTTREAERKKLLRPYLKGGRPMFEVPRWFVLVQWLREKVKGWNV